MAALWPSYARIVAPGYGLGVANDVERTPWDDGYVRQAKIYTASQGLRNTQAIIPGENIVTFRSWLASNAHIPFAWTDPEDGTSRQVRIVGGAGGVSLTQTARAGAVPSWEARFTLEGEV